MHPLKVRLVARVRVPVQRPGHEDEAARDGGALVEALRYPVGDMPTRSRKRELKEPALSNPTRKQISVMVRLAACRRSLARSIQHRVRYVLGVSP